MRGLPAWTIRSRATPRTFVDDGPVVLDVARITKEVSAPVLAFGNPARVVRSF